MSRGRRVKLLRKIINKYGTIVQECRQPPDPFNRPYRKGCYYANFRSNLGSVSCWYADKYQVYKGIVKWLKDSGVDVEI